MRRHRSAENIEGGEPCKSPSSKEEENVRPMVNYTKGMYCEIVIPEPNSDSLVPTVHREKDSSIVPMRRSQCKLKFFSSCMYTILHVCGTYV